MVVKCIHCDIVPAKTCQLGVQRRCISIVSHLSCCCSILATTLSMLPMNRANTESESGIGIEPQMLGRGA
jgi:hypothetical protein